MSLPSLLERFALLASENAKADRGAVILHKSSVSTDLGFSGLRDFAGLVPSTNDEIQVVFWWKFSGEKVKSSKVL